MDNKALKYWFQGLPYGNIGGTNIASGQKYWFNGLPFAPQEVPGGVLLVYRRPSATDVAGGWKDNIGGTDLAGALDETSQNDTDYIVITDPVNNMCRISLGGATLDGTKTITVGYTLGASGSIDFTVRLKQGATLITTWNHPAVAADITLYTKTLTAGERSAINWNNQDSLKLEFEANKP